MTPTPAQLALADAAGDISGTLDERKWALAELALDSQGVDTWAAIIGRAQGCSSRSVRGWACVAKFRRDLVNAPVAKFAYYDQAYRAGRKTGPDGKPLLDLEDIIEMMVTALTDHASADHYAAELKDMLPAPTPDYPARWEAQAAALLGLVDSFGGPVGNHLRRAALALSEAATMARKEAQA